MKRFLYLLKIAALYFIQFGAMAGDIIFLTMLGLFLYSCWGSIPAVITAFFVTTIALGHWKKKGGFIAWDPRIMKEFLKNAKDA